jgi:hypothetical protein
MSKRPLRNYTPAFKAKVGACGPSRAIEHWLSWRSSSTFIPIKSHRGKRSWRAGVADVFGPDGVVSVAALDRLGREARQARDGGRRLGCSTRSGARRNRHFGRRFFDRASTMSRSSASAGIGAIGVVPPKVRSIIASHSLDVRGTRLIKR